MPLFYFILYRQLTSKVDGGITLLKVGSGGQLSPSVWQPGFDLPRQQWSLLNRFRTEQGHCGACRRKWRLTDTDLCPCGEIQTMSHIVESCPLTKLNGGLSRIHSACLVLVLLKLAAHYYNTNAHENVSNLLSSM